MHKRTSFNREYKQVLKVKTFVQIILLVFIHLSAVTESIRSERAFAQFPDTPYWKIANQVDYFAKPQLLKSSTRHNFETAFVKRSESSKNYVLVEVIKDRQFAQWHLQMIKNSKKSFQKFFNQSFQRKDLIISKLEYDQIKPPFRNHSLK